MTVRPAHRRLRSAAAMLLIGAASLLVAACGSDSNDSSSSSSKSKAEQQKLVVYSGREKDLVDDLYKRFEQETGIKLEVRYNDSAATAAQLQEEGDRSPADLFYAQDAGAIGAIEELLAPLPEALVADVPAQYRDSEGRWTGVTGRVRTLVYNTDDIKEAQLPKSVYDVVKPEWKGKVGVAPTNASFIAFISAMRQVEGDDRARQFLDGLVANDAKIYEKNGPIVDAVGTGEIQVGLVNHYYLYERLEQDPKLPIANHFFAAGDIGNMVNTSAIGILASSKQQELAQQLIKFMLTDGQTFIVNDAPEREYPLSVTTDISENPRYQELPALADIKAPEVDLSKLGGELEATVKMIQDSKLGS